MREKNRQNETTKISFLISDDSDCLKLDIAHLNRDKMETNLSVPAIQGHQENAVNKSFEMSPHLINL